MTSVNKSDDRVEIVELLERMNDDGLTVLERKQIEAGKEAYLTGGAKLRYKRLTGQI